MTPIQLHCRKCKRSMSYERHIDPSIPETVTRIETDICDECDNGDFGGETWFDADGNEIPQDEVAHYDLPFHKETMDGLQALTIRKKLP